MPTVELTDEQVVSLIEQLPAARRSVVLQKLTANREAWWERTATEGEPQMRRLASERGLDWDAMSDDDRISFVDDLVHEDRQCRK